MPTLVILLAPFGAGVSAYAVLIQDFSFLSGVDTLSYALLFIGLFLLFALLPQVFQIGKCCPFRISWWAISFPLAAMCIASLKITQSLTLSRLKSQFDESYAFVSNDEMFFVALSSMLLIAVTLTFIWLLMRTLRGIIKGELKNLA